MTGDGMGPMRLVRIGGVQPVSTAGDRTLTRRARVEAQRISAQARVEP